MAQLANYLTSFAFSSSETYSKQANQYDNGFKKSDSLAMIYFLVRSYSRFNANSDTNVQNPFSFLDRTCWRGKKYYNSSYTLIANENNCAANIPLPASAFWRFFFLGGGGRCCLSQCPKATLPRLSHVQKLRPSPHNFHSVKVKGNSKRKFSSNF